MEREIKLELQALHARIKEQSESMKECMKTRDQVAAIRRALASLATVLESLPSPADQRSAADARALKDACRQLRRL